MEREPGHEEPERVPRFGRLLLVCLLAVALCGALVWYSVHHGLPDWFGP